jgi:photosystem II stability/assembly factor-like uncharacterized protein
VGRDTGRIVTTTDGGGLWTEEIFLDSANYLSQIEFADSAHGWIGGRLYDSTQLPGREALFRTTDAGRSWEVVDKPVGTFSFFDSLHGMAFGGRNYETLNDGFYVLKTVDGGRNWDSTFVLEANVGGDAVWIHSVSYIDSLNGWLFGSSFYQGATRSIIIHTSDAGLTWVQESIGLGGTISEGLMIDNHHGWAVGLGGEVMGLEPLDGVVDQDRPALPSGFILGQNYPNPFNSSTTIEFELPHTSAIKITVIDAVGRHVSTPVDATLDAGIHRIQFDASNLSSGTYYYSLVIDGFTETKRFLLIR